jgi:CRISPR-associated protein Cas1
VVGGVVEIAEPGRYLKADRGFLVVESTGETRSVLAKIDYDQFDALICSSSGFTISGPLLIALSERNKALVVCGRNYTPKGLFLPFGDSTESVRRISLQIQATMPFKKRMWQKLIKEKLSNQAKLINEIGNNKISSKIKILSQRVFSGDSDNKEAQAARLYWPALFGKEFLRSDDENILNSFLNYGYAILRSAICRAIVGFGLLPMFGIHHSSLKNYFAMADDILEPFRPIVDRLVYSMSKENIKTLTPEYKKTLSALLIKDVQMNGQIMPLSNAIYWTVNSITKSYEQKKELICLPILTGNEKNA